jgi:16S rRNA (guanine527-N7)-methyltransferase
MEVSERRTLTQEASRLGVRLTEADIDRLSGYVDLVQEWSSRIRLIGDREPGSLVRKHVPDCLALTLHVPPTGSLMDVGSGAGLPGLVIACVRPALRIGLLEPRRRRASFLVHAKATLGLGGVRVLEARTDQLSPADMVEQPDVVTARAVSLEVLLAAGRRFLAHGGRVLAMQSAAFTADRASSAGAPYGFEVQETAEYRLSGGEPRRVVVFRRVSVSRET